MSQATPTWFIAGTSSGFGRAFAEHALERAATWSPSRAIAKLQDLQATHGGERRLVTSLNVDQPHEAQVAVEAAVIRFGRIDVLINNAGYGLVGAVEEISDAELRAVMDTHFFGAMAVTHTVLPQLRARALR